MIASKGFNLVKYEISSLVHRMTKRRRKHFDFRIKQYNDLEGSGKKYTNSRLCSIHAFDPLTHKSLEMAAKHNFPF